MIRGHARQRYSVLLLEPEFAVIGRAASGTTAKPDTPADGASRVEDRAFGDYVQASAVRPYALPPEPGATGA